MLVYVATCSDYTRAAHNAKDALAGFGYYSDVRQLDVPDETVCVYRVYAHDLDIDELVLTREEAKDIIRRYRGQERRTIRRWCIPIEGGQLALF